MLDDLDRRIRAAAEKHGIDLGAATIAARRRHTIKQLNRHLEDLRYVTAYSAAQVADATRRAFAALDTADVADATRRAFAALDTAPRASNRDILQSWRRTRDGENR